MARFIDESPDYEPLDGESLTTFEEEDDTQILEEEQPAEPEEIRRPKKKTFLKNIRIKISKISFGCIRKLKNF